MTPPSPAVQPADNARDQVARLLALVPFLLSRGEVRLDEAAAHFGVDPAQVQRDLKVLFMVGLPGGYPDDLIDVDLDALEGDGVIRVGNADYLGRPVRLAPAEATALMVALRTMQESVSGETREVVARTLDKLERANAGLDDAPRMHVQHEAAPGGSVMPVLESAIAGGHRLRIVYHVPSRDEQGTREVDPRAVALVEGVAYLDAWCHTAGDDRVFRVDRIVSATELDVPVADPTARPRDLTRQWFSDGGTTRATLRVGPEARWIAEYHPVAATRPAPDGGLEVDLDVASEQWLRRLVLRLAPHATVVAPADLADSVRATAGEALRLYEGGA